MRLEVLSRDARGKPKDVQLTAENTDDSDFIEDLFVNGEEIKITGVGETLNTTPRNMIVFISIGWESVSIPS